MSAISWLELPSVRSVPITLSCGATTNLNTFTRIGGTSLDMSLYAPADNGLRRSIVFVADIQKSNGATSVEIQLVDVTNNVIIAGSDMISTSTSTQVKTSDELSVGLSAGDIRTDAVCEYEVQLKMNGGTPAEAAFCTNARLLITYS